MNNGGCLMYSKDQIKDMIFSYHWRKNVLADEGYAYDSNSVAQYGVDAAMPKAKGQTTDKVQRLATNNCVLSRIYDEHLKTIQFIDTYEGQIDNDMNLNILMLFKKGKKPVEIREIMNIGRTNLDSRINSIVNVYYLVQDKHNQRNQHNQHNQRNQRNQHNQH